MSQFPPLSVWHSWLQSSYNMNSSQRNQNVTKMFYEFPTNLVVTTPLPPPNLKKIEVEVLILLAIILLLLVLLCISGVRSRATGGGYGVAGFASRGNSEAQMSTSLWRSRPKPEDELPPSYSSVALRTNNNFSSIDFDDNYDLAAENGGCDAADHHPIVLFKSCGLGHRPLLPSGTRPVLHLPEFEPSPCPS